MNISVESHRRFAFYFNNSVTLLFHQYLETQKTKMFRQFFDTSFNDHRQIRVVVQELPDNSLKESSPDFQR